MSGFERPARKPTDEVLDRLERWDFKAGVVGLGYVGLPLLVALARSGIEVVGYDISSDVVGRLVTGVSHVDDVANEDIQEISTRARFTSDPLHLREAHVVLICVPTPLAVGKQPDLSFIDQAASTIAHVLASGALVILESTTYPGTTEERLLPVLEATGLRVDDDFLLAYSPERIDPGNRAFNTQNIPRVVGGVTERSTRAAALLYERFVGKVHVVSSARIAEFTKLLENTFRWVNIALVNELSLIARSLGVDVWEAIDAAATKPFGFTPFWPGPGVGGHCIPLDPFFLEWRARDVGVATHFIAVAEWINAGMYRVVADLVQQALNDHSQSLRGARVLAIGVAYKPNVSDARESPALLCVGEMLSRGADVVYADPHVADATVDGAVLTRVELDANELRRADCTLILCDHDAFDWEALVRESRLIVDTRNACRRRGLTAPNLRVL